jgi:hypothetical protein
MKYILIVIFINLSLSISGQTKIPRLKENGSSFKELIPSGWQVLSSDIGDLNKDDLKDLVFVIQNTDTKNFKLNDGLGIDTLNLNPRVLGIYFRRKTGLYEKQLQSDSFIIIHDVPTMDEPFDGIKITKKGILEINFHIWYSAGTWETFDNSYKFEFNKNEFELVGYDYQKENRGSGETTDYSINFLTKKMSITKGNISEDKPLSIKYKTFKIKKLKTIESLKKPFESEFEGVYL